MTLFADATRYYGGCAYLAPVRSDSEVLDCCATECNSWAGSLVYIEMDQLGERIGGDGARDIQLLEQSRRVELLSCCFGTGSFQIKATDPRGDSGALRG
jgi:hypothetical protein